MKYPALVLFSVLTFSCFAQDPLEDKIQDLVSRNNFKDAVPVYQKLIKKHPENEEYKYQLGKCLLKTHGNRMETISLLETSLAKRKPDAEAYYYLGQAYQHDLKFDKAMETYNKAKAIASKSQITKVERQIETCLHAKELIKYPINVTFFNLGSPVNSEYADYFPLTPDDAKSLYKTVKEVALLRGLSEAQSQMLADAVIAKMAMS